jgi:AcrR family transcriptional regulator
VVRQARSEATRQKIINAAVDLFSEVGLVATGLGDIVARAQLTKGALYFHFDSKESLAAGIIEQGSATVREAFRSVVDSSSPALEEIIHGMFVVAEVITSDKVARTGAQLTRALGEFNGMASRTYGDWVLMVTAQVRRASAEGDLRGHLDPDAVSEAIVAAMLGAELMTGVEGGSDDLVRRHTRIWEILLPAITTDESLPYFREFLARQLLRQRRPPLTAESPTPDRPTSTEPAR